MFRDRRWRSPWVHPRSGLENKDWIRLHRRPFRLQINSIKAWLPQVRPARSTCEGRRGGSNSSGAVLFDQGPATFVNEVNSSGRQWPDKTDTMTELSICTWGHIVTHTSYRSSISEFQNSIYDDSLIEQPEPRIAAGAWQQAGALCPIYESSYIRFCNSEIELMYIYYILIP